MKKRIHNFFVLQKTKLIQLITIFRKKDWAKILVMLAFIFIGLILAAFTYLFSYSSFSFLQNYPDFRKSISFYILSTWFFLIFILAFASGFISSLSILFNRDDDNLLFSLPIKPKIIFNSRFMDLTLISSWPIIVFGIPLLLAFKISFDLVITTFLISFLTLVILLLISVVLTSIFSILITNIWGRISKKISIISMLSLPFIAWSVVSLMIPSGLMQAFQRLKLEEIQEFLKTLPLNNSFLPSNWAVRATFYFEENINFSLINLGLLITILVFLFVFLQILVEKIYFKSTAKVKESFFVAGPQDKVQLKTSKRSFPYILKGIKGAFLEKDFLMLVRNQSELLQFFLILFISALYYFLLSRVPLDSLEKRLPNFSVFKLVRLNFVFSLGILSILGLRYIFPGISLEAQMAWIIWSAPLKKIKLFWQKFLWGIVFLGIISVLLSFFSTFILKASLIVFFWQVFALFGAAVFLVLINLFVGSLLPNFEEKNPEKISTSVGGLLTTFISLVYIFIVSFLLFTNKDYLFNNFSINYALIWIINIPLVFLALKFFSCRVNRYKF